MHLIGGETSWKLVSCNTEMEIRTVRYGWEVNETGSDRVQRRISIFAALDSETSLAERCSVSRLVGYSVCEFSFCATQLYPAGARRKL
jgi:hypothetical protein